MRVTLGFAAECEPRFLKSCYLPVMKIGGQPAWLDLKNIPSAEDVACGICKEPCIFLCQIYASDDRSDQAFHRNLFVFICRKGQCCKPNRNDNLKVFRSQLPRANDFYPMEPLDPDEDEPSEESDITYWTKVCRVCNIKAPSRCKKCKKADYCSRRHQIVDWKAGHDKACEKLANLELNGENKDEKDKEEEEEEEKYKGFLFPEYEIVSDDESGGNDNDDDDDDDEEDDDDEDKEKEKEEIEKFEKMVQKDGAGSLQNVEDRELEDIAKEDDDEAFTKFKKRFERRPDQVIRYQRGGKPLYASKLNKPQKIPECENCKSKRTFEFQIMPQLLNKLDCSSGDGIDWGVLLVYTCEKSCDISGYQQEFIWKQDYTDTTS